MHEDDDFEPDFPDPLLPDDGADPEKEAREKLLKACADEPETDIGNGRRMRRRFGDLAKQHEGAASHIAIRVAHIGWHVFDGRRWKEDEDGSKIRPLAHQTAEAIRKEATIIDGTDEERAIISAGEVAALALENMRSGGASLPDPDRKRKTQDLEETVKMAEGVVALIEARRTSRRRHAKSTAGSSKINNMMEEMGPYVSFTVQDLNTDKLLMNCRNGTLAFVQDADIDPDGNDRLTWRVELRPHSQGDYITKLSNASWQDGKRPDAKEFEKFLKKVQPDALIRAFLKRFCGYMLTGLTIEQVLLFFYGAGRNGKSTFVELLCHVMGDYAVTMSIDSFSGDTKRGGGEATPDLARLPGARFVSASEPEAGVKLKDALIKLVTGNDKFPVRRLHEDFFEIDPTFKLVLSGNHKPRIDDDSDGIWRRVLLVPWLVQIPKAEVDRNLLAKLKAEADGVFAWMVEGAVEYLNLGLDVPASVHAASEEYRQESDAIGTFIRLASIVTGESGDMENPLDLFMAFERFADAEGVFKFNRSTFEKKFSKASERNFEGADGHMRQFVRHRSNGKTIYRGIRIRPEWMAASDGPKGGYGDDRL